MDLRGQQQQRVREGRGHEAAAEGQERERLAERSDETCSRAAGSRQQQAAGSRAAERTQADGRVQQCSSRGQRAVKGSRGQSAADRLCSHCAPLWVSAAAVQPVQPCEPLSSAAVQRVSHLAATVSQSRSWL